MTVKIAKIKLTRKTIQIKTHGGVKDDINAWVYEDTLAFHKEHNTWILTHIPTGYKIIKYLGKYKHIRAIVAEVGSLINWSLNDPDIIKKLLFDKNEISHQIKDVIKKYE